MAVTAQHRKQVRAWAQEALTMLGFPRFNIHIEWNSRFTRRMGDANYMLRRVRFSIPLWDRASEVEQRETVIHEVCHLIAFHKYGLGIKPHGMEWKDLMRRCGVIPNRCHKVDREGILPSRITISCPNPKCDKTFHLTTYMAGQVAAGSRICNVCKTILQAPAGVKPTERRTRRSRKG